MGKNTIWYGLEPMAAVHKMNEGDLLFYGNKAFRKEKGNLEEIKKAHRV
ncbi:hypothetical protein [Leuconostoc lactis]|nr:hypothetical protein [Leuconostoc lactis]